MRTEAFTAEPGIGPSRFGTAGELTVSQPNYRSRRGGRNQNAPITLAMPPRARDLLGHLMEGSLRPRYGHLLGQPLPPKAPDAWLMLSPRVEGLWARLIELQDAWTGSPTSKAAAQLGVEVYRKQVLREFCRTARQLSEIAKVLLQIGRAHV